MRNVDISEFKVWRDNVEKLMKLDIEKFCKQVSLELAQRLLRKVILRTLPGQYPPSSGKQGGTLRRGWQTQRSKLKVQKIGSYGYLIVIVNPVEYASYVEYGHRTRNHKGWVMGKFILTNSVKEIDKIVEPLITKRLNELLLGVF